MKASNWLWLGLLVGVVGGLLLSLRSPKGRSELGWRLSTMVRPPSHEGIELQR